MKTGKHQDQIKGSSHKLITSPTKVSYIQIQAIPL